MPTYVLPETNNSFVVSQVPKIQVLKMEANEILKVNWTGEIDTIEDRLVS